MMDEDDNRQHFSLKKIMENEKKSIKKKNRKKGKQDVVTEDTFQINVKDPRFEALYTSHHFSLDPSDPQFRLVSQQQSNKQTAKSLICTIYIYIYIG